MDERNDEESLLLHVFYGRINAVRRLLAKGVNPNCSSDGLEKENIILVSGTTPLHIASLFGFTKIASLLLDYGANINALDSNRHSVLRHAIVCAKKTKYKNRLVSLLLNHNSKLDKDKQLDLNSGTRHSTYPPLHVAASRNMCKIASMLLAHGANVNYRIDSNTKHCRHCALHVAIVNKCHEMVSLLLNHGADINSKDINDRPPSIICAAELRHNTIAKRIVDHIIQHDIQKDASYRVHVPFPTYFRNPPNRKMFAILARLDNHAFLSKIHVNATIDQRLKKISILLLEHGAVPSLIENNDKTDLDTDVDMSLPLEVDLDEYRFVFDIYMTLYLQRMKKIISTLHPLVCHYKKLTLENAFVLVVARDIVARQLKVYRTNCLKIGYEKTFNSICRDLARIGRKRR